MSEDQSIVNGDSMKKRRFVCSKVLPLAALIVALFFASQAAVARSADSPRNPSTQQQQMPDDQNAQNTGSQTRFSGKIVKSGDKLVLTDGDNNTTYQLDDQQKAHDFLNRTVKVTGILDASTGTIKVTAIEPV
jgi:hypothetical protein